MPEENETARDAITPNADGRPPTSAPADPSLAALAQQLLADGRILIHQEVSLARTEIEETARNYMRGGAVAGGGAVLIVIGFAVLLASIILGLGALLGGRYWLSTLIVGSALALAGGVALYRGRRGLRSDTLVPEKTIASARATARWAREEAAPMKGRNAP
jgi:hypothetical protein